VSASLTAELSIKLIPRLEGLGAHLALAGRLSARRLEAGGRVFELDDGVEYDLELTNTGGAVLLSGKLRAQAQAVCDRCLSAAVLELDAELQEYLVFCDSARDSDRAPDRAPDRARESEKAEPADSPELTLVSPSADTDLLPFIESALVFELPMTVLCTPACAGLCPRCGANRNVDACGCDDKPPDGGAFAVLEQLLEKADDA
jgi:uncharacterized protein